MRWLLILVVFGNEGLVGGGPSPVIHEIPVYDRIFCEDAKRTLQEESDDSIKTFCIKVSGLSNFRYQFNNTLEQGGSVEEAFSSISTNQLSRTEACDLAAFYREQRAEPPKKILTICSGFNPDPLGLFEEESP